MIILRSEDYFPQFKEIVMNLINKFKVVRTILKAIKHCNRVSITDSNPKDIGITLSSSRSSKDDVVHIRITTKSVTDWLIEILGNAGFSIKADGEEMPSSDKVDPETLN